MTHREDRTNGLGSFVALTFLAAVFLAGVWIGAHVTLATLAGRP